MSTDLQSVPKCDLNSNNDNGLKDIVNSNVPNTCQNGVEKASNSSCKTDNSENVAKAILEISKLPLSDIEKADMIRLLLKDG